MASNDVGFHDHVVLGTFSTDEDKNYCNDLRNRRFFVEPDERPNFDLTHGIDDFAERDYSDVQPTSLTPVLEWIRDHQKELKENGILKPAAKSQEIKMDVDFIARRGILGCLLRAGTDAVEVDLMRCFLVEHLEQIDGGQPDIDQPINASSSYYSMTKATCGDYTFLFSGETVAERKDAVERPPTNYVDVNTNKALSEPRFKTLKWWSKNHISGVSDIVVGWRDDRRNVVTSTAMMRNEDLPNKAAGFWDPASCVSSFLSLIKDIRKKIPDDDPRYNIHRFPSRCLLYGTKEAGDQPRHQEQLKARRFSFSLKEDDYVILKDWYLRDVLKVPE
ncbi:decapping and exoribonuclease protein-like [Diadema antillarum]|uniref:decapping and exoribonuclease protein-like n=1 Tax=Diadema antillarum TaxID=105358 RepID=UPI003A86F2BA